MNNKRKSIKSITKKNTLGNKGLYTAAASLGGIGLGVFGSLIAPNLVKEKLLKYCIKNHPNETIWVDNCDEYKALLKECQENNDTLKLKNIIKEQNNLIQALDSKLKEYMKKEVLENKRKLYQ